MDHNKSSLRTILKKNLVIIFLLLAIVVFLIVGFGIRSVVLSNMNDKALEISGLVKAGLTAHMKSKTMDKRDYFLKEISSLHEVDSLKIIRSAAIDKQFGVSDGLEKKIDSVSKKVFNNKSALFIIDEYSGEHRILVPYIADSEGSLNCLSCHDAKKGDVLGIVDMEFDFSEYQIMTIKYLFYIFLTLMLFFLFFYFFLLKIIYKKVITPLKNLVDVLKKSNSTTTEIDSSMYENIEMFEIADDINSLINTIKNKNSEITVKNIELKELNIEINSLVKETLLTLGSVAEMRSEDSKNHIIRVSEFSRMIASYYGMEEKEIELIAIAATIHDLGKIAIPDYVLLKKGILTEKEFDIIKEHTKFGYEMLKNSERDALKASAVIAMEHHEKYDGNGYPHGKKGKDIHLYARIVTIADVYDALSHERCYKEAWPGEKVYEYFKEKKGVEFDPELTEILLREWEEFEKVRKQYREPKSLYKR